MFKFKKICILSLAIIGIAILSIVFSHKKHLNLSRVIHRQQLKYHLPGLSVSIIRQDQKTPTNYTSGFTTVDGKKPITSTTLFQMGSITKTFTATIILMLEARKTLNIAQTVGDWLPQYPKWKNITIKQLLNHTSGIFEIGDTPNYWENIVKYPHKQISLETLLGKAYIQKDYFTPGKQYHYSNTDYLLLGMIIKKATGESLKQCFVEYIVDNPKLHLHSTFLQTKNLSKELFTKMAHGYNYEGTFPIGTDVTTVNMSSYSDGAIISTPSDVATFIRALFNGELFPKEQLDEMLDFIPVRQSKDKNMMFVDLGTGFGVGLVKIKGVGEYWMHAGGMLGYESVFAYSTKKHSIVVLAYNARPKKPMVFMRILSKIFINIDGAVA